MGDMFCEVKSGLFFSNVTKNNFINYPKKLDFLALKCYNVKQRRKNIAK